MDKFIYKTTREKSLGLVGRKDLVQEIRNLIIDGNLIIVYGQPGVGKTAVVKEALMNMSHVFIDSFKVDYSESNHHIVIDEQIQIDQETLSKLSKGSTLIITHEPLTVGVNVYVEPLCTEDLQKICPDKDTHYAAEQSGGNIHNYKWYCQFSDIKDTFKTPKDYITDILCNPHATCSLAHYMSRGLEEHGYSLGIVHENYPGIDDIERIAHISESLSIADTVDARLYEGHWDLFHIFMAFAIAIPCLFIQGKLDEKNMKPGSCWTKFNNYKMRDSKLKIIKKKIGSVDLIHTIIAHCRNSPEEGLQFLRHYKLTSQDLDVINHLCIDNKLKPRIIQNLKKALNNESTTSNART
jgi:Cdc6-like AAA superfamily ATPase